MLNPVSDLSTYVQAIGTAYVFLSDDPTDEATWELLGITEGEIQVDEQFQFNDYKLPEWTGEAVHARNVDGQSISITIPLVWGDPAAYDKVAPLGVKGGGRSVPQAVETRTVLIVPRSEVGEGLEFDGATWTPAAPVHAIWLHKATFAPGQYAFKHADGGKMIRSIVVMPMFDNTKPEGQKLYTIGDVNAQGITTYRV